MAIDGSGPDDPELYYFKIISEVGEGSNGRVYRCLDTRSGDTVAVKLFDEASFRDAFQARRLTDAVDALRALSHLNLAKVYRFIDGTEGRCLVYEYADGPNLAGYLENHPWSLEERLAICSMMCNGLQYLHDNGCVHHNLKPTNVLFTRKGLVKLDGFALHGDFDQDAGWLMTPKYVPPELLRREPVTAASDQYSLGILIYLIFAGKEPFRVDTLQELYQYHLETVPERPDRVDPRCPPLLGDIIMRTIAKRPADRFADCSALREALSAIEGGPG